MYGLIFDVDGVIADTEPVNVAVTIRVFEDLFGVTGVKPEDFAAGIGRGDEEYVRAGAGANGLSLTDEQAKKATQLRETYFIEALNKEPLPVFPGVLRLINTAIESGDFRVAIATSGSFEKSRAILKSARVPYEKLAHVSGNELHGSKTPILLSLGQEQ